jgi:hypothetical protein
MKNQKTPICRVTLVTSSKPARLTKQFCLRDGELQKVAGGVLVEGRAEVQAITNLAEFKKLLMRLISSQALTYGIPKFASEVKLTTQKKWLAEGRPDGVIPRTQEMFEWPDGPGIMMFDYDPQPNSTPLNRKKLRSAISEAVPGLADVAMLWWASASSHILNKDTGEELNGLRGQRLYVIVEDAGDIPRATDAIVTYIWANGGGHFEISKSGSLLPRTILDTSVWQTNRLDFAAGADCVPPLCQKRGKPITLSGKIKVVDTISAIPNPPDEIKSLAAVRKATAKKLKEEEAGLIREEWTEKRVIEMVGVDADEEAISNARATIKRALEHDVLSGDFMIKIVQNSKITDVAVSTVLDNPLRYHGMQTLDPIEPEYDGYRAVGKLFVTGVRPTLHSFAHGGRTFKLRRQLSKIELVNGRTHDSVEETLEILKQAPEIFDFGGALVSVGGGKLHPLDEHGLIHYLGGIMQYWRWHKPPHGPLVAVLSDPPPRVAKPILSMGENRQLKSLKAVVTAPTLRPDGTVMDAQGYDPKTGLLLETDQELVPVKLAPSQDEVAAALNTLLLPFSEFPLEGPGDWGVLLAGLLTAAVRPALPTSPAFGFDAPIQASGKTLLASCLGALATGEIPTIWPHTAGRDDEEVRKRLFTALRNGTRALVWDNLVGQFDSAAMAAALTAPNMTDRILGKSESISIPNRAIMLLTGNNLTLAGDMPRRVLICRINPNTDRPFSREFDLDPLAYVNEHRQGMVSAALTIVRGWLSSGAKRAPGRMASFELWDDYVRQPVAWIDQQIFPGKFTDPMQAVTEAQSSDPELEIWKEVLLSLQEVFGESFFTTSGVLETLKKSIGDNFEKTSRLCEALVDLNRGRNVASSTSLGRLLGYRRDRIVAGLQLQVRDDLTKKIKQWRVANVDES